MVKFALFLLFVSILPESNAKTDHPIYDRIVTLKPKINKKFAMHLSNLMHRYSRKYKQDPMISVGIAMQESGIRNISRKERVVLFNEKNAQVVRGYTDLCIFQIHIRTAKNYGMDLYKLYTDLDYCVEQHFKIMRKKRKVCKKLGKDDWTCYHSYTDETRKIYKKLVERYL